MKLFADHVAEKHVNTLMRECTPCEPETKVVTYASHFTVSALLSLNTGKRSVFDSGTAPLRLPSLPTRMTLEIFVFSFVFFLFSSSHQSSFHALSSAAIYNGRCG